jgi:lysozyme
MLSLAPESVLKLHKLIELDEGFRQFVYHDSKNVLTIGYGFNLESDGLPRPIADLWLDFKLAAIESELNTTLPLYGLLNDVRRIVLLDIAFNCGVEGLMGFRQMIAALTAGDYETASKEILNSEIATNRRERLAYLMEKGSYD